MTVAPMFELLAILAISALAIAATQSSYQFERQEARAAAIAADMLALSNQVQSYCQANNDSCVGATVGALQSAGLINAGLAAQYAGENITISSATGSDFVISGGGGWLPAAVARYNNVGTITDQSAGGAYLLVCSNRNGLVASQTGTCP